ncbi:DUF4265 domain-containing protein [uncultured Pontibacter sp.]|uniref:DUF4265 domain-containing protein n=1 Tax=uncultured Pontibacter sp. TaxID=453356 RepID=UPI002605056F|nr:DUF4265 domain-containing protein [uncultured Pontibacter sp.]
MSKNNQTYKIIFRFYSDVFEQEMVETLWAKKIEEEQDLYKIDSIPSFVPLIATDDIVRATYNAMEEGLVYQETVTPSGNSTIQVIRQNEETPLLTIRKKFAELGCISEEVNEDFFVLEVPLTINYAVVKELLDDLEAEEEIEYAEPALSDVHREQTSS